MVQGHLTFALQVYICCDEAFLNSDGNAAFAAVLLNSSLNLMDSIANKVSVKSTLGAEALDVHAACLLGKVHKCPNLVICSDSKSVMDLASLDLEPLWKIATIINDIRLMASSSKFHFIFVPRNYNEITHWVAKSFVRGELSKDWVINVHPRLSSSLNDIG